MWKDRECKNKIVMFVSILIFQPPVRKLHTYLLHIIKRIMIDLTRILARDFARIF